MTNAIFSQGLEGLKLLDYSQKIDYPLWADLSIIGLMIGIGTLIITVTSLINEDFLISIIFAIVCLMNFTWVFMGANYDETYKINIKVTPIEQTYNIDTNIWDIEGSEGQIIELQTKEVFKK